MRKELSYLRSKWSEQSTDVEMGPDPKLIEDVGELRSLLESRKGELEECKRVKGDEIKSLKERLEVTEEKLAEELHFSQDNILTSTIVLTLTLTLTLIGS